MSFFASVRGRSIIVDGYHAALYFTTVLATGVGMAYGLQDLNEGRWVPGADVRAPAAESMAIVVGYLAAAAALLPGSNYVYEKCFGATATTDETRPLTV